MSWFTGACLLVSNIIGGAIFTTTGFLARDLGDPRLILLLWVFGGVLALAGAMCYAELGAALPYAGGDYIYLRTAYSPAIGFLSGWSSFTVGFGAALAASCVSFATYGLRVAGLSASGTVRIQALALGLLWSMTLIHAMGTREGGVLQRLLTTTQVLAIAVLIVGGLTLGHGDWAHFHQTMPAATPGLAGLAVPLIFVLYTYLGWNIVGYIAGEMAEPQRNIPRVVIGGTLFVSAIYVLLNVVYLYALPMTVLAQEPLLPVAEKAAAALWTPAAAHALTGLLCLAIAGGISAMVWAGPRVYRAMARDGAGPSWLLAAHPATGVPQRAMLAQSLWASLLIVSGTYEQLVIFSGFVLALLTALTVAGLIVLRQRSPELSRSYRVPLYPWTPLLVVGILLLTVGYSLAHRPLESLLGLATILAGLPLYARWKRAGRKC